MCITIFTIKNKPEDGKEYSREIKKKIFFLIHISQCCVFQLKTMSTQINERDRERAKERKRSDFVLCTNVFLATVFHFPQTKKE